MYVNNGVKSSLLNKQAIMNEKIYNDFRNKRVTIASNCGKNCLVFIFSDQTQSVLKIDEENQIFHYGDYTTKLVEGSKFGTLEAKVETVVGVDVTKTDSMIRISIPVTNNLLKGDYGVNAIYQYNSHLTSISDVTFNGIGGSNIYLKGSSSMSIAIGQTFTDPGYFTIDENGAIVENDSRIIKTGTVNTSQAGTYTLTYQLKSGDTVIDTKTRTVVVTSI